MSTPFLFTPDLERIKQQLAEPIAMLEIIRDDTCNAEEADLANLLLKQLIAAEQSITDYLKVPW